MKGILFIVLAVSLSCALSELIQPAVTSPALLWSNKNYFSGKNIQIADLVALSDISNAFSSSPATANPIAKFFTKGVKPEVIFVFAEPSLSTEEFLIAVGAHQSQINGGQFSNLKQLIESSTSSVVAPYVNTSTIRSLIQTIQASKIINVASQASEDVMSVQQFVELVNSGKWELTANGVTDLVVVQFDGSFASDDKALGSILSTADYTYVALFTSARASVNTFTATFGKIAMLQEERALAASDDGGYWPDGVVAGLIIMVPFLIILAIGVSCTFNIQSALKFDGEKKKQ